VVRDPRGSPRSRVFLLHRVVSSVVIQLRFPVDLRTPSHNKNQRRCRTARHDREQDGDATDPEPRAASSPRLRRLMLQGTPTPFSRTPGGTGRHPHARQPHRGRARRSEGGAPGRPSCCWAPSCRDHHSPPEPGDECATRPRQTSFIERLLVGEQGSNQLVRFADRSLLVAMLEALPVLLSVGKHRSHDRATWARLVQAHAVAWLPDGLRPAPPGLPVHSFLRSWAMPWASVTGSYGGPGVSATRFRSPLLRRCSRHLFKPADAGRAVYAGTAPICWSSPSRSGWPRSSTN
jgi:hypothetical protein